MSKLGRFKRLLLLLLATIMVLAGCTTATNYENNSSENIEESNRSVTVNTSLTSASSTSDYSSLFSSEVVHEINIQIDPTDWAEILASPEDETYYATTVTLDGQTVENVGFRTKGNSSLKSVASSDSERYSFRVKFDKYVDDQTVMGLDELVLNNMFSDPSYLREYISYTTMREAGLNVPECSFVNVSINGELVGFYLMVEAIDDSFLVRNFGENDSNLYKAESGSNLLVDKTGAYTTLEQKNGKNESKEDLINFIDTLNQMPTGEKGDIESVLDVESALNYIAANTVLENYDSYNGTFAQNYYLYQKDGKFVVIPWDYNMSFGGFQGGGQSSIDIDTPISGTTMEKVPLINNLLSVPEYKEKYEAYIKNYMSLLSDIEEKVTSLQSFISDYVSADPTKFVTYDAFITATTFLEGGAIEANNNFQGGQIGVFDKGQKPENGQFPNNGQAPNNGQVPDKGQMPPVDTESSASIESSEQVPSLNNEGGNNVAPPQNGDRSRLEGDQEGGRQMGGMSLSGSDVSIINIMLGRIENLKGQLEIQ